MACTSLNQPTHFPFIVPLIAVAQLDEAEPATELIEIARFCPTLKRSAQPHKHLVTTQYHLYTLWQWLTDISAGVVLEEALVSPRLRHSGQLRVPFLHVQVNESIKNIRSYEENCKFLPFVSCWWQSVDRTVYQELLYCVGYCACSRS